MVIHLIPDNVQSKFMAIKMQSLSAAVEELIYNSLDARSTSIAIRVSIQDMAIQVIDNGCGIHKNDMNKVGFNHMTSKTTDLNSLKRSPSSYGYHGQALASIIAVSEIVKITSRHEDSDRTVSTIFLDGKLSEITPTLTRPSKGTTVEIKGLLYNLNIQKKKTQQMSEIQDIKQFLKEIALAHCGVSMSLRDDIKNEIIFDINKNRDIYQTLQHLYGIQKEFIQELSVEKNNYKVTAYISKNNSDHHWVYLNGRCLKKSKLNEAFEKFLAKCLGIRKNGNNRKKMVQRGEEQTVCTDIMPFYVIFLTCPYNEYDIEILNKDCKVEFVDWEQVSKLFEKLAKFYVGDVKIKDTKKAKDYDRKDNQIKQLIESFLAKNNKKITTTQFHNGVKGKKALRTKNKSKKNNDISLSKVIPKNYAQKESIQINLESVSRNHELDELENTDFHKTSNNHNFNNIPIVHTSENNQVKFEEDKKSNNDKVKSRTKTKVISRTKTKKLKQNSISLDKSYKNINEKSNVNKIKQSNIETINNDKILENKHIKYILEPQFKTTYDLLNSIIKTKVISEPQIRLPLNKTIVSTQESQISKIYPKMTYESHNYIDNFKIPRSIKKITPRPLLKKKNSNKGHINIQRNKCFKIRNLLSAKAYPNNNLHKGFQFNFERETSYTIEFNDTNSNKDNRSEILSILRSKNKKIRNLPNETLPSLTFFDNSMKSLVNGLPTLLSNECQQQVFDNSVNLDINNLLDEFVHLTYTKYNTNVCSEESLEIPNIAAVNKLNLLNDNLINTNNIDTKKTNDDNQSGHDSMEVKEQNECYLNDKINFNNSYEQSDIKFITSGLIILDDQNDNGVNDDNDEQNFVDIIKNQDQTKNTFSNIHGNVFENDIENNEKKCVFMIQEEMDVIPLDICETVMKNSKEEINNDNRLNQPSMENIVDEEQENNQNANKVIIDSNSKSFIENSENITDFPISNEIWLLENTMDKDFNKVLNQSKDRKNLFKITNKNNSHTFGFINRPRFVPKGFSQIFDKSKPAKNQNNEELFESEYFNSSMYDNFLKDVELNKKVFEPNVQNIKEFSSIHIQKVNEKLQKDNASLTFDGVSLIEASVIGQVDNKFIAAKVKSVTASQHLVLFDQHAVHERIRLEDNMKDYLIDDSWISIEVENIRIKTSTDDLVYLHNYKDKFMKLGLNWNGEENHEITIVSIPKAILGSNVRSQDVIKNAVMNLIREEIESFKVQKCVSMYPKSIMDLVFSEACRYAIKFGEKLSLSDCQRLLYELSQCKTPFQCAHGRPVMAVLMDIRPLAVRYKVDLKKLQRFKNNDSGCNVLR